MERSTCIDSRDIPCTQRTNGLSIHLIEKHATSHIYLLTFNLKVFQILTCMSTFNLMHDYFVIIAKSIFKIQFNSNQLVMRFAQIITGQICVKYVK